SGRPAFALLTARASSWPEILRGSPGQRPGRGRSPPSRSAAPAATALASGAGILAGAVGGRGETAEPGGDLVERRPRPLRPGFERMAHRPEVFGHRAAAAADDPGARVAGQDRVFGHQFRRAVIVDMPLV